MNNSVKRPVSCYSETGTLQEVILGYADNFHKNPDIVEIVSVTQAAIYHTADKPTAAKAIPEFDDFQKAMESRGVTVHKPKPCEVPDQLTPRDIGFVIGDTFFVASMNNKSRKNEWQGIAHLVDTFSQVVHVPDTIVIEGGDIVVDKGCVFVGISQRTTVAGFKWLKAQLENSPFQVVPVPLKGLSEGEHCLHLDCVFVPVGTEYALIYPGGMQTVPDEIKDSYQWIEVTKAEQGELATNVLSLSPTAVVVRHTAQRLSGVLSELGFEVIPLQFDEAPKTGGSFRCCTLPLVRS